MNNAHTCTAGESDSFSSAQLLFHLWHHFVVRLTKVWEKCRWRENVLCVFWTACGFTPVPIQGARAPLGLLRLYIRMVTGEVSAQVGRVPTVRQLSVTEFAHNFGPVYLCLSWKCVKPEVFPYFGFKPYGCRFYRRGFGNIRHFPLSAALGLSRYTSANIGGGYDVDICSVVTMCRKILTEGRKVTFFPNP